METALGAANWEAALSAVERNAGAPGPDGMKASRQPSRSPSSRDRLTAWLREDAPSLR